MAYCRALPSILTTTPFVFLLSTLLLYQFNSFVCVCSACPGRCLIIPCASSWHGLLVSDCVLQLRRALFRGRCRVPPCSFQKKSDALFSFLRERSSDVSVPVLRCVIFCGLGGCVCDLFGPVSAAGPPVATKGLRPGFHVPRPGFFGPAFSPPNLRLGRDSLCRLVSGRRDHILVCRSY